MTFQFNPLAQQQFFHLYGLSDNELKKRGIIPYIADAKPGYPCRVTLQDAKLGSRLLLLNFQHLAVASPYRSSHAIFVQDGAVSHSYEKNRIPNSVLNRLVSIRSFDDKHMMLDADVAQGQEIHRSIERLLAIPQAHYLHVHTARRGCYLAAVTRC